MRRCGFLQDFSALDELAACAAPEEAAVVHGAQIAENVVVAPRVQDGECRALECVCERRVRRGRRQTCVFVGSDANAMNARCAAELTRLRNRRPKAPARAISSLRSLSLVRLFPPRLKTKRAIMPAAPGEIVLTRPDAVTGPPSGGGNKSGCLLYTSPSPRD